MPKSISPHTGQLDLASLLARLETWLKRHRRRFAKALKPGATEADFSALRDSLHAPVPDELRQLLSWHNGQSDDFDGAFMENWNLMSAAQIGNAKGDLAGQPAWIPFLDDDTGNYLVLDSGSPGCPVREYRSTEAQAPTVAPSLTAWMGEFVAAVEARQYHEDRERGWFIKQEKRSRNDKP